MKNSRTLSTALVFAGTACYLGSTYSNSELARDLARTDAQVRLGEIKTKGLVRVEEMRTKGLVQIAKIEAGTRNRVAELDETSITGCLRAPSSTDSKILEEVHKLKDASKLDGGCSPSNKSS